MPVLAGSRARPSARARRPSEAFEAAPSGQPPGPLAVAVVAVWFGLLTGLAELGLTLALEPFYDAAPGLFRGNRHILWIIPTVNLATCSACGGLLALLARVRPRLAARLAGVVPCFIAFLSVLLTVRGLYLGACIALAAGLALRVGRRFRPEVPAVRTLVRRSLPALVLAVAVVLGASFDREVLAERRALGQLPAATAGRPNVLLIVLDTVRADRLGAYGYGRDTTPHLDRWARDGVRFERAYSTAPWTLPSHASMFTGRWPHELSAGQDGPLDDRDPTLAEALRDEGYLTAGFVANTTYCSAETGLNRGFVHYEDHILSPRGILRGSALGRRVLDKLVASLLKWVPGAGLGSGKGYKDAATINRELLDWVDAREAGRPFFAFLNYFDAHHPYVLPEGYDRHFGVRPESRADDLILNRWWSIDKRKLPPRDLALARDAYDDCIGYLDAQLGRLFEELSRRGVLERTVVIVTADHGEHLGEHGLFGHASSLYGPEVHVPLMIVGPPVPGGRSVREPVSARDLPATIVDLLGLGPDRSFPGRSLARFWGPSGTSRGADAGPILSEVDAPAKGPANGGRSPVFRGAMKSLVTEDHVYIRNGDGREELYDLAADPLEARDLAGRADSGRLLERFRDELDGVLGRDEKPPHFPGPARVPQEGPPL